MFDALRQIVISGHSMDRAGLVDGMVVWVLPTARARHGDVVVVRLESEELVVKRLMLGRFRRAAWLVPESSDRSHRPRRLGPGDAIVGVVLDAPPRFRWR